MGHRPGSGADRRALLIVGDHLDPAGDRVAGADAELAGVSGCVGGGRGAHLHERLEQVVGGAVEDVAEGGEGPRWDPVRCGGDQPVDLGVGQVDPAGAQQGDQVGGLPQVVLGHDLAQVPVVADSSLLSHRRPPCPGERDAENPFYQIYMMSLETGDTHRISPGMGKTTCSFFRPNSDEVLFASTHLDSDAKTKQQAEIEFRASGKKRRFTWDYDTNYDIFSAKRDGTALRRLTSAPGYDAEGAYSPDGSKIVFCSLRNAYPVEKLTPEEQKRLETNPGYFGEIYIMNADGSDQKRLTTWDGYDGGPFFQS